MTSHEFARQLLAGPDLYVGLQPVEQYSLDDKSIYNPVTFVMPATYGRDFDGNEVAVEALIISY